MLMFRTQLTAMAQVCLGLTKVITNQALVPYVPYWVHPTPVTQNVFVHSELLDLNKVLVFVFFVTRALPALGKVFAKLTKESLAFNWTHSTGPAFGPEVNVYTVVKEVVVVVALVYEFVDFVVEF